MLKTEKKCLLLTNKKLVFFYCRPEILVEKFVKTCEFYIRRELWRSEMLTNDLDPVWKSTFVHEYRFEESQPIKIEIYDWDTSDSGVTNHLKDQDLIGRIETNMASLVSAKQYNAVLRNKANKGQLNIMY